MTKFLLLLFSVLSMGCSYATHNAQVFVQDPVESWLQEPTYDAARFWEPHGIDFLIGDQGNLSVVATTDLATDDRVGEYHGFGRGDGEVRVVPGLEYVAHDYTTAVIAHEFGHSINMDHVVQSASLMAPVLEGLDKNNNPFWSNLDQAEFDRVHGQSMDLPNLAEATHGGEVNETELHTIE